MSDDLKETEVELPEDSDSSSIDDVDANAVPDDIPEDDAPVDGSAEIDNSEEFIDEDVNQVSEDAEESEIEADDIIDEDSEEAPPPTEDTEPEADEDVAAASEVEEIPEYLSSYEERRQQTPKEVSDEGFERWSGERGESLCRIDDDEVNCVLNEFGVDGIEYKDCVPDFTPVSKGNVEIAEMSEDRLGKNGNFTQADMALAAEKGCEPRDVRDWRQENGYTWHECNDRKTCQKIPSCVNSKFGHLGGVSECKKAASQVEDWEDQFDELP